MKAPTIKERENARLSLALLKENFEYQKAFAEFKPSFLMLAEMDKDRSKHLLAKQLTQHLFMSFRAKVGLNSTVLSLPAALDLGVSASVILQILDPEIDSTLVNTVNHRTNLLLFYLFQPRGIFEIYPPARSKGLEIEAQEIGLSGMYFSRTPPDLEKLEHYQRVLLVDLRAGKKDLMEQFERFIDVVYSCRNRAKSFEDYYAKLEDCYAKSKGHPSILAEWMREADQKQGYTLWTPKNKREREEAWQQLKIWKLRKQHKGFEEIAQELKLPKNRAEKAFYKAFERTQNKKYDPDLFLFNPLKEIKKNDLKKTCETCPDKSGCRVLCPDMLKYVDQDQVTYTKERLFSNLPFEPILSIRNKAF